MRITKFGHSSLLIEEGDRRILIDPGGYSTGDETLINIDAILLSHEHGDHTSPDKLRSLLSLNPNVKIYSNKSVVDYLNEHGIHAETVVAGVQFMIGKLSIEPVGERHSILYRTIPTIENTGYLIADKLLYPGDNFTLPPKAVEILAAPMAGPWLKLDEAISYVLEVKPKVCFPVHDGILKQIGTTNTIPAQILPPAGIEFRILTEGEPSEF